MPPLAHIKWLFFGLIVILSISLTVKLLSASGLFLDTSIYISLLCGSPIKQHYNQNSIYHKLRFRVWKYYTFDEAIPIFIVKYLYRLWFLVAFHTVYANYSQIAANQFLTCCHVRMSRQNMYALNCLSTVYNIIMHTLKFYEIHLLPLDVFASNGFACWK